MSSAAIQYTPENEAVLMEFDFADGCVNAGDEDALRMAHEIVLLRHVVRILAGELSPPCNWAWMKGSPADEAYYRALNSGSHRGQS